MGLITPNSPSWAYYTHNIFSIDAGRLGARITTGVSNADGSSAILIPTLTHDVEYLRLLLSGSLPTSGNNDILLDVLIDRAGGTSWDEFIPDLIVGAIGGLGSSGNSPAGHSMRYDFPIWIPAGASLGIHARSAHSVASVLDVCAIAMGGNANPASWWCGQRVTSIGINASSSTGTAHTASTSSRESISGAADNGSGLIRLTVGSTANFVDNQIVAVVGVVGTVEANGIWRVTVVDGTHLDLQLSSFVNTYSSDANDYIAPGVFSSWANLGSPLPAAAGALQFGINGPGGTFYSQNAYMYEFGVGGSRIGPPIFRITTSNEAGWASDTGPIFKSLPAGTQLQVRGACSGVAQALGVAAYAVH